MYPPPRFRSLTVACAIGLLGLIVSTTALAQVPPIVGDLNDDGFVGIQDQNVILSHWNQTVTLGDWSQGDPSGDGFVGIEDLNAVLGNWNAGYLPLQEFKGMNLPWVNYWTRQWVFVDVMKISDKWRLAYDYDEVNDPPQSLDDLVTDANDWPKALPQKGITTYIYTGNVGTYPTGRYVCTYDGVGTLEFDQDADVDPSATVVGTPTTPGRIEFDVDTAQYGIRLTVRSTGADPDCIRNIKIWMPGFENASSPFHPLFIKRLRPFKVIRFMDWQETNDQDEVSWANRNTRFSRTQGNKKGVALEYMVDLCNELEADPWFCMPHITDDTENLPGETDHYVKKFAEYVKSNLSHSQATVYVEWSNEAWNTAYGFTTWSWLEQEAETRVDDVTINTNIMSGEWFQQWAIEAAEDFEIWYDKYDSTGDLDHLVRVAAGQSDNSWVTWKLVDRLKDRNPDQQFDAISCAAYFSAAADGSGNYNVFNQDTTAQDVVDYSIDYRIPHSKEKYEDHGKNAPDPGEQVYKHILYRLNDPGSSEYMGREIKLLAYEAGQHYSSFGATRPYSDALFEAQRLAADPVMGTDGMYDAIIANMTAFKEAGGSLYVGFNLVTRPEDLNGEWGHLGRQDEPTEDAHKFRALLEYDPDAVPDP